MLLQMRQLLYDGSQISQEESDILIMSFIIRWGLEEKGIEHLLCLINCHMPIPMLGSKYIFLKRFHTPSMTVRYSCSECDDLLLVEFQYGECKNGNECDINNIRESGNFLFNCLSQNR